VNKSIKELRAGIKSFLKILTSELEKQLFYAMLNMFYEVIDKSQHPDVLLKIDKRFKGNTDKYAEYLFSKTFMTDENKVRSFLDTWSASKKKALSNDPLYVFDEQLYQLLPGSL